MTPIFILLTRTLVIITDCTTDDFDLEIYFVEFIEMEIFLRLDYTKVSKVPLSLAVVVFLWHHLPWKIKLGCYLPTERGFLINTEYILAPRNGRIFDEYNLSQMLLDLG